LFETCESFAQIKELDESGLFLTDLNQFDGGGEILITDLQHKEVLSKAFEAVI
jgi:hypothetical protein